jgi:hypothetical protein
MTDDLIEEVEAQSAHFVAPQFHLTHHYGLELRLINPEWIKLQRNKRAANSFKVCR